MNTGGNREIFIKHWWADVNRRKKKKTKREAEELEKELLDVLIELSLVQLEKKKQQKTYDAQKEDEMTTS